MKVYHEKVDKVWSYFSESRLLDLWWAPKPWKCSTKNFQFENGGKWLYAMIGPQNEEHFAVTEFDEITFHRSISWKDAFADSEGKVNPNLPFSKWLIGFTGVEEGTKLTVNIFQDSEEDLKKLLDMGFEEGFRMCLNQLEEIMSQDKD